MADQFPRLDLSRLGSLPAAIERPRYDRRAIRTGIVHLGIGAFHRAHQAAYTEAVADAGDLGWGICGVSLRSPATRDALAPQEGLYTVAVRSESERLRVVGVVRELLVAEGSSEAILARLCEPEVRIASLTVTEKGYHHHPATGELDEDAPAIQADLARGSQPLTAPGILVEAIRRRREAGLAPFTALTCDNLPHNGRVLGNVLSRFAALRDPDLGAFVAGEIACPSTMVDRIVPSTTDADRAAVAARLGFADAWPVMTEPFTQWVIEDRFVAGRPEWERAGAEFVDAVAPYEEMKLRLLNGSHSALAYLGALLGIATVDQAIGRPELAGFVERLMEDATETLSVPPGADIPGYRASLIERFSNPALKHRLIQIAMDGSQKLPQRILSTVRARLAAGRPVEAHALAVASWMRFAAGTDLTGKPLPLDDPKAEEIRTALSGASTAEGVATALLGLRSIFGDDLAREPRFTEPLVRALTPLLSGDATAALSTVQRR